MPAVCSADRLLASLQKPEFSRWLDFLYRKKTGSLFKKKKATYLIFVILNSHYFYVFFRGFLCSSVTFHRNYIEDFSVFFMAVRSSVKRRLPVETNPMSGVFQNIDPPPPHSPASVSPPATFGVGEDTPTGWRGGVGSIVRKTPDTALYSTYVSTL
jgi:hypothetical protein